MVQTPITHLDLYPDSDGQPMAENTVQYRWIVRLVSNLKRLFAGQNVFVAGDLLWYPVQVQASPVPAQAPDAMVVFGRPPGDRGSYKQWQENDIPPQVVFEILSPSNTRREIFIKQTFYQQYGVLEMFFYDPDSRDFWGFVRETPEQEFSLITPLNLPWTSPLLQIRFELGGDELRVFHPNGELFQDPEEVMAEREQIQRDLEQVTQERDRALAKLRELGIDPNEL
ncbi:Uma2 family endonuclease [Spirulina subsalsa]|uniref:Uma2 family endonuclease n=1 Tax=Spirulina subsalsa TaxID=54311 RepID=UPI0002EF06A0|nr:Uma2 family endonuclease [Spirulina subsalsa]